MKESVLDILIYLFEHYMLEHSEHEHDEETIVADLMQAGFNHTTIGSAFDWLENLALMCEAHEASTSEISTFSMRHYTPDEADRLNLETRSLLLALEQSGILSPVAREMAIDSLMTLDTDDIDIHHVKWVILMVLTNCSNKSDDSIDWTEALLLDEALGRSH